MSTYQHDLQQEADFRARKGKRAERGYQLNEIGTQWRWPRVPGVFFPHPFAVILLLLAAPPSAPDDEPMQWSPPCLTTKQAQAIRIPAISNSSCAPNWFGLCLPRADHDPSLAVGLHPHAGERLAAACRPAGSANNRAGPTLIHFLARARAGLRSS